MAETPAEYLPKLTEYFDTMVARAEQAPPQLIEYKDPATFSAADKAYKNNPLLEKVREIKAEVAEQSKGATPEQAQELYQARMDELKESFLNGAKNGAPDPDAEQKQQGIMQSLINGDWMGVIKQLLLSIPFVGDTLAAAGKWGMAKLNGEDLSFSQAKERIALERALDGAAGNLGLGKKNSDHFISQGTTTYENPDSLPPLPQPDAPRVVLGANSVVDPSITKQDAVEADPVDNNKVPNISANGKSRPTLDLPNSR